MTEFIRNLKQFNRKERFYVVGLALGNEKFVISAGFRKSLSKLFDGLEMPERSFAAMDYHLDWIYASAFLASADSKECKTVKGIDIYATERGCMQGTQEDIDFVIAFPDHLQPGLSHLIMIEAKGDTPFTNKQLSSKVRRLSAIFGSNGERWKDLVVPHFGITSPKPPTNRLKTDGLPPFMLKGDGLRWLQLETWQKGLRKPTLCDALGNDRAKGPFWKFEAR